MPTLMSASTFKQLNAVRERLLGKCALESIKPANIFVPWAGSALKTKSRGVYYVGIAVDKEAPEFDQTFGTRLQSTEEFCAGPSRSHAPFWRFLDRITTDLLGGPYNETQRNWGWSNLFKIGSTTQALPCHWPTPLYHDQRLECVSALKDEIGKLHQSLVVICSSDGYGILSDAVAPESAWNRDKRASGTYTLFDPSRENLFVHCNHPNYMVRSKGMFAAAESDIVTWARQRLPSLR
jgi:hypothetical protein